MIPTIYVIMPWYIFDFMLCNNSFVKLHSSATQPNQTAYVTVSWVRVTDKTFIESSMWQKLISQN